MSKSVKKLISTFLVTLSLMYACFIFISQQATFVDYKQEMSKYNRMIEEEEFHNTQLTTIRDEISSDKYIEEIAREKLGFVLPSEIVFMNVNS